jgi:hypothetical protein
MHARNTSRVDDCELNEDEQGETRLSTLSTLSHVSGPETRV